MFNYNITRVREVSCLKRVQYLILASIWRNDFRPKITPKISPGVPPKFFGQFLGGFSLFRGLKPNEDEKRKKFKLLYCIFPDWENALSRGMYESLSPRWKPNLHYS